MSRGNQVNRKDKDLMSDTGGTSKGRDREPSQKPSRDDLKNRYRSRRKNKYELDKDLDLDPDMKSASFINIDEIDYNLNRKISKMAKEIVAVDALIECDKAIDIAIAAYETLKENLPQVKAQNVPQRAALDNAIEALESGVGPYLADIVKYIEELSE